MSKKGKCIDCAKNISIHAKRCKSCAHKGKKNPQYKHGYRVRSLEEKKYKFCIDCGKKIDYTAIRCIECSNIYRSGENSSTWKGGIDAQGYVNSKFTKELKQNTRKRDNNICQLCGKEHTKGKVFDVHHIDYNKTNNIPSNLITLCNKCHTKTSIKNREYWYVKFKCKLNKHDHWLKVTWEDACSYSNESLEEIKEKEQELVDTFGKITYYDINICVVMTHDSRSNSNDYIRIPTCLIRKIET